MQLLRFGRTRIRKQKKLVPRRRSLFLIFFPKPSICSVLTLRMNCFWKEIYGGLRMILREEEYMERKLSDNERKRELVCG